MSYMKFVIFLSNRLELHIPEKKKRSGGVSTQKLENYTVQYDLSYMTQQL